MERSYLFFNGLFLYSSARAYGFMRRGKTVEKMRWTLRAMGILLGIATTRPVIGFFFATSRVDAPSSRDSSSAIAFWIGFSVNTIAIELWLRSRGIPGGECAACDGGMGRRFEVLASRP